MPFLTYPLALLGLATVPGLVAIYLLHRRFERREVTALFLWSALARAEQGGRRLERFRMPLLFLVELLALVALALAATDLRYVAARAARPVVVVLDDSYSLQAVVEGTSARDRGLVALREELDRYRPTSVRVILAGADPQVAVSAMPPAQALEQLERRWHCLAPSGNLVAALSLAAEVGEPGTAVVVVTDQAAAEDMLIPGRRWLAVGLPAPNAAFIAARRGPMDGDRDHCFLQVANPGRVAVRTALTVTGDGQSLALDRALDLPPGGSEQVVFALPKSVDVVRAELADDALGTDNHVLLLPPRPHLVRVANVVADAGLRDQVDQALAASGLRDPSPGVPELVISDRSPGPARAQRWTLEIRVPKNSLPFTGPFVADWGHRLIQGLDFGGVVWAGEAGVEPEGQPVLMAGNTSLLADQESGGGHALRMCLDITRSTISRTPNWPALFWNLLDWRAESHPGFVETEVRLGQTARLLLPPVPADAAAPVVRLEPPDGPVRELAGQASGECAVAAAVPGVYSAQVGGQTYRFACNALSPQEGDLGDCRTARLGADPTGSVLRRDYASGAWVCGLLACGLLFLHAFLLRPRVRS